MTTHHILRIILAGLLAFIALPLHAQPTPAQLERVPYWQARAVAALELKDYRQGWQAGQALLKLNALDSEDATVRQVVAALNAEGWLEKDLKSIEASAAAKRWKPWLGTWKAEASCDYRYKDGDFTDSGSKNEAYILKIEWFQGKPNLTLERHGREKEISRRGNWSDGHETTESMVIPGKSTMNERYSNGDSPEFSSSTTRILDIILNETGDTLTVKTERKNDANGKVTTEEYRYMLSADGRQLYIINTDTGQTRADFARYNGTLYIIKKGTLSDSPVIVALAKQN